jgi:hypothetical protein
VPRRHTNRLPFASVPVATADLLALRRAALQEGAWLHFVDDPDRRSELGSLATVAYRTQAADPRFRAEVAAWTGRGNRPVGVPAAAGGPALSPAATVCGDGAGFSAGHPEPPIIVLTSYSGGPVADVRAGAALQRVLLAATVAGLAASFLSPLVQVGAAREQTRRMVGSGRSPQVVLRIGHAAAGRATPRLPVESLLLG